MEKTVFKVEGMSCQHCVKAVTDALSALPGVTAVSVDLAAKTAAAEHDPVMAPADKLRATIEEQG